MNPEKYLQKFNRSYEIHESPDQKYIVRTSGATIYIYNSNTYN